MLCFFTNVHARYNRLWLTTSFGSINSRMFVSKIAVECWLDGVTRNSAYICRSVQGNDTEADITQR